MEGSDRRWREQSQVQGCNRRRRGEVAVQCLHQPERGRPSSCQCFGWTVTNSARTSPSPSHRQSPESARAALSSKPVAAADSPAPKSTINLKTRMALSRVA